MKTSRGKITVTKTPWGYMADRGRSSLVLDIHPSGYRDFVGIGDVRPLYRAILRQEKREKATP